MYGAVELGDVVLTFVGIHGLFGLEVYARLGWHFDGVRDCGILATGLHEVLVGLFRHLRHCVPFCYAFIIAYNGEESMWVPV